MGKRIRSVAQLVEHRSPKPGVGGSSPSTPAIPHSKHPRTEAEEGPYPAGTVPFSREQLVYGEDEPNRVPPAGPPRGVPCHLAEPQGNRHYHRDGIHDG